jgi:hypothetical protein
MPWYGYIAYFFIGVFGANGVPHFVQGICGNHFQTPFASPPGKGNRRRPSTWSGAGLIS